MNEVENFFDRLAPNWDKAESHTDQEKLDLLNKVGIQEGDKIIDIACGTGVITSLIHDLSKADVTGIDLSSKMIELAKQKYQDQKWASFQHLDLFDLKDEPLFDVAIIYNAYPHFVSPAKLSQKLSKILKKNGRFAILHSMSKEELDHHHASVAANISRSLKPAIEESKYFVEEFDILQCGESQHSYFIIGKNISDDFLSPG